MASFVAYMQQTAEHNSLPMLRSLDPTHWINPIFFGFVPSEGLIIDPFVGPLALRNLSNSVDVTTFSCL